MRTHTRIGDVDCYGVVRDNSNFYIVCDNEEYDGIWADGNPDRPDGVFRNWTEVVRVIKREYRRDLVELQEI